MGRAFTSVLWLVTLLAVTTLAAEEKSEVSDRVDQPADKSRAVSYTRVVRKLSNPTRSALKSARYSESEGTKSASAGKSPRYAEAEATEQHQGTKEAPVTKGPEYEQGFVPSTEYGNGKGYDAVPPPGYGLNKGLPVVPPGYGTNKGFLPPGYGVNKGYGGHAALIPIALVPVYSHHGYHGGIGGFVGYHGGHHGFVSPHGYIAHPGYGKGEHVKTVTYTKEVPVPVPHLYPIHVEKKVPYPVKYPVAVPYDRPVPVHVYKPVPYPVERPVPYPVERPVPYPVKVPVKVPVPHPLPYPVPTAVPVYVKPVHGHGYYDPTKLYDDYSSDSGEHDGKSSQYSQYSDGKY